jgi:hypothetical protein
MRQPMVIAPAQDRVAEIAGTIPGRRWYSQQSFYLKTICYKLFFPWTVSMSEIRFSGARRTAPRRHGGNGRAADRAK